MYINYINKYKINRKYFIQFNCKILVLHNYSLVDCHSITMRLPIIAV